MHIDDSHFPIEYVWDGELEPPPDVKTFATRGGGELPRVSIGRPVWWSDQKVLGEKWTAPAGGRRYGLARFAFSLRPQEKQTVRKAELIVRLSAKGGGLNPIAFDLFPKPTTEEQTGEFNVKVGPDFKFAGAELSVASAETTVNLRQAAPVITVDGIGESFARWVFAAHSARPLVGSQLAYATIELPPGVAAARASVQLSADVASGFRSALGFLPERDSARLSWVLGE